MVALRFRKLQSGMMLATALVAWMLPSSSRAYTGEQQQACSGDAFRLCSAYIPDVERITACMVRNRSQLTPACAAFIRPEPEYSSVSAGRPLSIKAASSRKWIGANRRKHRKSASRDAS
jgi:hypothetical protein